MKTVLSLSLFLLSYLARHAQASGVGPCHPYPGATAQDCLELIGNNLGSEDTISLGSIQGATLSLRNCAIVTIATSGSTQIDKDTVVRRALTAIGSCALSDLGSISGSFTGDDGVKTCYLYPGKYVNTVPFAVFKNTN